MRAMDAIGEKNIWITGSGGTIIHSDDGGLSWTNKCPEAYEAYDFRGVAVLSDSIIIAMSAGDGSKGRAFLIKSTDKGKSWRKVLDKKENGVFFDTIKFRTPWEGYLLGDPIDEFPYLLKTTDAGETWSRVGNLPKVSEDEASFAASNSCITILGNNIWFNTQNRVFHSFNSGQNWQTINTQFMKGPSMGIFGIFAIDANTLIAVGGDYLPHKEPVLQYAHSHSGGQSWYTHRDFWKIGLTECIDVFGPKKHLLSVGTHGSAISTDTGLSWEMLDDAAFHIVKCFGNKCIAAGSDGRIGIRKLE